MEEDLRTEELDEAISGMSHGRSGIDGLTVEFYKIFWQDTQKL